MKGGDIAALLKQVQAVQTRTMKVQEELAGRLFTGTAGGGAVTVEATGALEIRSVGIAPEALGAMDRETLEAAVAAAVNDALRKAQEAAAKEMGRAVEGLPIPGLIR